MKEHIKVEVGQIWEVEHDMYCVPHDKLEIGDRNVVIREGEKIEIRFPTAWYFRTEDGFYASVAESNLLENCKYLGKVWDKIQQRNNADLNEIIKLKLYD